MDKSRFTESMPGELRRFRNLSTGKDDWLFVPQELPSKWEFPTELWPLLADAKEALGTLNGIGQTLPNPELLLQPLQSREAITSSSIEGTYVTPQQLLLYELDPKEPNTPDGQLADWREVFNYGRALKQGCALLNELPICSRLICAMHKTLMDGARGEGKSPGAYRPMQVQIGSEAKYVPPPAAEVERLMSNLERQINSDDQPYDKLVMCYIAHYQFEAIHPFADGNGRVGRALLALMIYKWLGHTMPWLYMSAYFERYKEEYTDNLFRISSHGDWATWIRFCLNGTIIQAADAIRRCDRFKRLRQEFHDRVTSPTPRTHAIIEKLFAGGPIVRISGIEHDYKIAYHTARKDVERLVSAKILAEFPNEYPRTFFAREIMEIAYRPIEELEAATEAQDDSPEDTASATPPTSPIEP